MQAGDYTATGVPESIRRQVYVNGVHRHHVSDSWDAEIGSDLPEQVSAVTGIKARTGSVVFAPVQTVTDTAPSPLRRTEGWPPRRGDELTVSDSTATQHWTRATARITDVRAGLGSGEVEVDWSDDLDSALSQTTELPPVASTMPGSEVNEYGTLKRYWYRTAVEPWSYVVEALEDADFRLLPSLPSVDFYAMFQGSVHPRVGRIDQTYSQGELLEWDTESGFQYLAQWSYFTPGFAARDSNMRLGIFLRKTVGGPDAQTRWTMADGAEIRVTLINGSAAVSRDGVVLAQQGFTSDSPLPWVGVNIGYNSTTIWTPAGVKEESHETIPVTGLDWSRVRVLGAAALAVAYEQNTNWPGFNWPSLRYRGWGRGLVYEPTVIRSVEPRTVRSLLDDIASATLTGYWLDEHGILQWAPSNILEGQSPVETITTRADVLAGSWTETSGGVASTVIATYEAASLTTASTVSVVVKEGSGSRKMTATDRIEEFVGPEAEQEWIEPDMSPIPASQNSDLSLKRGIYSVWGGSYVAQEGDTEDTTNYGWATVPNGLDLLVLRVDPLTPRQWKVAHYLSSGSPDVQLVTLPGGGTSVPVADRGTGLPIWRARGLAGFTDATYTSRLGPSWAPAYEHDLGAWGSRQDARRVGDWLGQRMASIQIVLSQLDVMPDPRRQLGDVIEVNAAGAMGGVLRCLIIGIHESSTAEGVEQALDLRVIRATESAIKTYGGVEDRHPTYEHVEDRVSTYQVAEDE